MYKKGVCIYRVRYSPWFQASIGGPGTCPPQVRDDSNGLVWES